MRQQTTIVIITTVLFHQSMWQGLGVQTIAHSWFAYEVCSKNRKKRYHYSSVSIDVGGNNKENELLSYYFGTD